MFEMTQALNTIGVGYKCYNKDSSHKNGAKKFQYSVIFVDVAGCATLGNNYLALQENLNLNWIVKREVLSFSNHFCSFAVLATFQLRLVRLLFQLHPS